MLARSGSGDIHLRVQSDYTLWAVFPPLTAEDILALLYPPGKSGYWVIGARRFVLTGERLERVW
jgi:hypothetical protein